MTSNKNIKKNRTKKEIKKKLIFTFIMFLFFHIIGVDYTKTFDLFFFGGQLIIILTCQLYWYYRSHLKLGS